MPGFHRASAFGATLCSILFPADVSRAAAQAYPTALRSTDITVFGGATAVYTGLSQGRNKSVTVGRRCEPSRFWALPAFA